jgi:hypothetical protein
MHFRVTTEIRRSSKACLQSTILQSVNDKGKNREQQQQYQRLWMHNAREVLGTGDDWYCHGWEILLASIRSQVTFTNNLSFMHCVQVAINTKAYNIDSEFWVQAIIAMLSLFRCHSWIGSYEIPSRTKYHTPPPDHTGIILILRYYIPSAPSSYMQQIAHGPIIHILSHWSYHWYCHERREHLRAADQKVVRISYITTSSIEVWVIVYVCWILGPGWCWKMVDRASTAAMVVAMLFIFVCELCFLCGLHATFVTRMFVGWVVLYLSWRWCVVERREKPW